MASKTKAAQAEKLVLLAPFTGPVVPIEKVPDPVFSERLLGDGVAIDPVDNVLLSPAQGQIVQLYKTGHALTLKTPENVEILIHIGLDTVALEGKGFKPLTSEGQSVQAGQPLIEFDMDYLACHARSLISVLVLTQSAGMELVHKAHGHVQAARENLLTLSGKGRPVVASSLTADVSGKPDAQSTVTIPNPMGLHARPAALLARGARHFPCHITLSCNGHEGRADSVTEIMKLNTRLGDQLTIKAWGMEAEEAVEDLVTSIGGGLGDEVVASSGGSQTAMDAEPPLLEPPNKKKGQLQGVTASPGLAIGHLVHISSPDAVLEPHQNSDPQYEQAQLTNAIAQARSELNTLIRRLVRQERQDQAGIFNAHQEILGDPAIALVAEKLIQEGNCAAAAWRTATDNEVQALQGLNNAVLAQRASDIRDVGNRVLTALTGTSAGTDHWPDKAIPVYDDLTPSDLLGLDLDKVVGLCSLAGGSSSHAAIIARSMKLPYLAGMDARIRKLPEGSEHPVILDADKGILLTQPDTRELRRCELQRRQAEASFQAALKEADKPAITMDGVRVEVAANIGSLTDAVKAVELGAEGVGLLRTEFLYLGRPNAPSEDEQTALYSDILKAMGPKRPVVIRTLDVGGDKPLPYLMLPAEANPFLGERGIRVSMHYPALLRTQVRALLRSAKHGKLRIMLPMVTDTEELTLVRELVNDEARKLKTQVEVGVMIEVPSAAIMARELAQKADFFSLGTNDLTQYTLAIDRGHPRLAGRADGLHPAVLRMIRMTVEGSMAADSCWTGVCGGLASDTRATALLLGLGVKKISADLRSLPLVKAHIRKLNMNTCRSLAEQALEMETPAQVRALLAEEKSLLPA